MFRVTMTFGGKPVKKYTFEKASIAIGRDASCEIVVENIGASRRHATIEKTPEGYVLEDLKSHNGTFVGGEKIFHHQLRETDEFYIGKYAFQFEALEPVAAGEKTGEIGPPPTALAAGAGADMTFRLDRKEIEKIIGQSRREAATQLVQIAPESEKQSLVLDKVYYVMGRHATAEVKLHGLLAPKRAGVVVRGEHGWRVVGLSRKLRVNGKRVDDGPLADGDLIQVGRRRFRFCQA
jgi:pSer/pThr/pTyr-binding forkhead associated (FHA) protein